MKTIDVSSSDGWWTLLIWWNCV